MCALGKDLNAKKENNSKVGLYWKKGKNRFVGDCCRQCRMMEFWCGNLNQRFNWYGVMKLIQLTPQEIWNVFNAVSSKNWTSGFLKVADKISKATLVIRK
jgi:hypothetical protein